MKQETEGTKKIVIVYVYDNISHVINEIDAPSDKFQYDMNDPKESRIARNEIVDWLLKGKVLISSPQF